MRLTDAARVVRSRNAGPRADVIGCDMGSVDPGPDYLGARRMATSSELTRRDLASLFPVTVEAL